MNVMSPSIRPKNQQPAPAPQPQPWSRLQSQATDLGSSNQDPNVRHLDGIRWDIVNTPDGECIEEGVFSDIFINPSKVKDVFLCIKPFTDQPMNAPGHALLKFTFEEDSPVRNSQGQTDEGFAVSIEQHFHQGEPYDPNKKNPVIHQLGTWTDAIEKATVRDHYPLQIYKMTLNQEQKVALLNQRLDAAVVDSSNSMYDAINNSCLSNLIDGINLLVPEEQKIPRQMPDGSPDPSATVPVWCANTFQAHRLIFPGKPYTIPGKPKPQPPADGGGTPPANGGTPPANGGTTPPANGGTTPPANNSNAA